MSEADQTKMSEEEYLAERLEDQIRYYSRESTRNKRWFRWLAGVEITAAALLPFLVGQVDESGWLQWLVGALGVVVAVIGGLLTLFKFQENWVQYRTTAEQLKHEQFLFQTRTHPYSGDDPFGRLVERTERLISREHSSWIEEAREKPDKPKSPAT